MDVGSVEIGCDTCDFDDKLFSPVIVSAVKNCGKLCYPLSCSSSLTVKGTKYSKGAFVVINCADSQPVFGKILLCLLDRNSIGALVVEECKCERNGYLGLFVINSDHETQRLKCVLSDELYDYYPLHAYNIIGLPTLH